MKKTKTLLFILIIFAQTIFAQAPCEIDTSNGAYGLDTKSIGYKLKAVGSNNFLMLSETDLNVQSGASGLMPWYPKVTLTKIDQCGNLLWSVKHDTLLCLDDRANGVSDILIDSDESAIYSYYSDYRLCDVKYNPIHVLKTDKNGNLKWKYKFGDSSAVYKIHSILKIANNKLMLAGTVLKNAQISFCTLIIDTTGIFLSQNFFTELSFSNISISSFYQKHQNNITINGLADSNLIFIQIDTNSTLTD